MSRLVQSEWICVSLEKQTKIDHVTDVSATQHTDDRHMRKQRTSTKLFTESSRPSPLIHIQVPHRPNSGRDNLSKSLNIFHRNSPIIIRAHTQPEVKVHLPLLHRIGDILSVAEKYDFNAPVARYHARLLVE